MATLTVRHTDVQVHGHLIVNSFVFKNLSTAEVIQRLITSEDTNSQWSRISNLSHGTRLIFPMKTQIHYYNI
jgi:hypothetical protein